MTKNALKTIIILISLIVLSACSSNPEEPTSVPTGLAPTPTRLPPTAAPTQGVELTVDTESRLAEIRERGVINVGVLYNYPPFGFLAESGEVEGYEVALIKDIAERWEIEVNFVQVTRQTRLDMLNEGQVDMLAAAMPHTRQSEAQYEYSATTFVSGYVILIEETSGIASTADLAGLTVGITSPSARAALEALPTPPAEIVEFGSIDEAVTALQSGSSTSTEQPEGEVAEGEATATPAATSVSVDAVVGRREAMMLATDTFEGGAIVEDFVAREPYAFAFKKGDTPLRDLVNLTLQEIVNEGVYGEIFRNNIYGYAADVFPTLRGEPTYTFADMPTELLTSESVMQRIQRGEAIRVAGFSLAETPAAFDGQPIVDGYNRAVINEMASRWGVSVVEIPNSTGDEGLRMLESGEADLYVGVRPDMSLIGRVYLTQPYYQRGLRLFHMDDVTVFGVGNLEFRPALALFPEDVSSDLIEDNNAFPRVEYAADLEDGFKVLTLRAVDAAVADEFIAALMAQADARIEIYGQRYRPVDYVMATSAVDADFQALVNITLQDMAVDGVFDRYTLEYFVPYRPDDEEIESFRPELWPEEPLN